MLQTRLGYTVFAALVRQRYQRGILRWSSNEVYITIRWDTANRYARNSCGKRYSLFLLAVGDYKRLDTSLYFITTNFHTELKPQVKVSHDTNSPAFTLCTTFD